ncbi:MAG TPA: tetratricopeptide repeat protein, partial [Flavisolibacter sp.]|nr:tetratricopeptide repeat protein [Flavisolibacter sp.]
LIVRDQRSGNVLVSYQKEVMPEQEIPEPALAAKRPGDVENNEQLFLTGLHLEQYRHATYVATDYYEEALRRDPKDVRCNNAMGLWFLRRGQFKKAEPFFRNAIVTLTQRNPNPYDGEVFYNLGWSLTLQGRNEEAYEAFYKSVWNDAWQHAGYLNLARLAAMKGNWDDALDLVEKSLIKNYHSHTARHANVFILRKLKRCTEAAALIESSLAIDPFNFGCLFEKYLLLHADKEAAQGVLSELKKLSHDWVHNYLEYALDYAQAGLYEDAEALLKAYKMAKQEVYPLVDYYLGWVAAQRGNMVQASEYFKMGAAHPPHFVFPNRIEEVLILEKAIDINPKDAHAFYYLGNFWYDKRQYKEAIACWERAAELNPVFPTVFRNLSLAYYNKLNDPAKSLEFMENAFALDTTDARVLMELDQLYKKLNKDHLYRLQLLEQHLDLALSRDDLYLERVTLYNQLGNYSKAKELIADHIFHPWEGGEGKVVGQYLVCHLELAKEALNKEQYDEAIHLLEQAENYPSNLGEGKLYGAQENDIHYLKGLAYEGLANESLAQEYYQKATEGISEPVQAIFYNDPQPDKIFYQGLAWIKLGQKEKATAIFEKLISFGKAHLHDVIHIDYFAVSLPDLLVFDADLNLRNRIHCLYLMGLGKLGLGNGSFEEAHDLFDEVLSLDVNHQGAGLHRAMVNGEWSMVNGQ